MGWLDADRSGLSILRLYRWRGDVIFVSQVRQVIELFDVVRKSVAQDFADLSRWPDP